MRNHLIPACFLRQSIVLGLVAAGSLGAMVDVHAQSIEPLRNVVQLSATGQVEVNQDWLLINLATSSEGRDAAVVQKQLQQTVETALRVLKPQAQDRLMQVRSGSFGVYPRHSSDGKIKGWQGRAEILLEGSDFARISQAAALVGGMTIAQMGVDLSPEGRRKVQDQAQSQAIENFKQRAAQLSKQFGFASYTLREVSVNSQDGFSAPRMPRANMAMSASAKMEISDPIPVEAGKEQVTVNVSGSVQLQ